MGSAAKIKLDSFNSLFGLNDINSNGIIELDIKNLITFKNHPFKIVENEDMEDLIESICENGVISPIIVRPINKDKYEIISGHRRRYACEKIGLKKIPAIIRELDDDTAINAMVDSNFHRKELLPSEKAYAYKMKLEAMKRQSGRPIKNSAQIGQDTLKQNKKFSVEILADELGESKNQIQRYIRLTYLEKTFLDMVDLKEIPFNVGVELSYLDNSKQLWILKIMQNNNIKPSIEQAKILKNKERERKLTKELAEYILCDKIINKNIKINIDSETIYKYFPKDYSKKQIETVIFNLLENWSKENDFSN